MPAYLNRLIYLGAILGAGYLVFGPERASEPLMRRYDDPSLIVTEEDYKIVKALQGVEKCSPYTGYCTEKFGCNQPTFAASYKCNCATYDANLGPCLKAAAAANGTCSDAETKTTLADFRTTLHAFCVRKNFPTDIVLGGGAKPGTEKPETSGASVTAVMSAMSMALGLLAL